MNTPYKTEEIELHGRCIFISDLPHHLLEKIDKMPLPYELVQKTAPVNVIAASSYNPLDYGQIGDDEEEQEVFASIFAAYMAGDINLEIQPQECASWPWLRRIPTILHNVDQEWRLMAIELDLSGIGFIIAHRDPAADGTAEIRCFMLTSLELYVLALQDASGKFYNYVQRDRKEFPFESGSQSLSVTYPDHTELITICESRLHRLHTRLKVEYYHT